MSKKFAVKLLLVIGCVLWFGLRAPIADAYLITWSYATGVEDGFRFYRKLPTDPSFIKLTDLPKDARQFRDTQSGENVTGTCFQVTAFNALGESPPATICANTPGGIQALIVAP